MSVPSTLTFGPDYFRESGWWRDETLADWLDALTELTPEGKALSDRAGQLTYKELRLLAYQTAAGLQRLGIGQGDVVAVHLPNVREFLIVWLAINIRGAVMQTIHLPYGQREIESLLSHSGAKAAIALGLTKDRSPAGEIAKLRDRLPLLEWVVSVGPNAPGALDFAELLSPQADETIESAAMPDDPFLLLYTSGTTSAPKAVSVTYNHFLSNARLAAQEFGLTRTDRILCLAPYTHLYGLYTLQLGFAIGAQACLVPVYTPDEFIEAIKRMRPTVLFGAPGHVGACLQQRLFQGIDLSDLRIAVLSGTTVPPELSTAFEHMLPNGKVMQAWGMTELQFGACGRPSDARDVRFSSVGRAMPGSQLRVVDESSETVSAGEIGELQIRGCSVFSGYVGNAAASVEAFTGDGWFRTGDLAEMDRGGNVRLRGRIKDIVNRGGIKFNPAEVEAVIGSHTAVVQVAIAPVPDPSLGERAAAFVVLQEGATLTLDTLKSFLEERKVAKFMWPEQFEIVADMPMTPTRKIIKAELVRRLLAKESNRQSAA